MDENAAHEFVVKLLNDYGELLAEQNHWTLVPNSQRRVAEASFQARCQEWDTIRGET